MVEGGGRELREWWSGQYRNVCPRATEKYIVKTSCDWKVGI